MQNNMEKNTQRGMVKWAPVSIEDVKTVLGESSNDLATLCKSENINIWSKYKPISCRGEFKESPIREDSYETATSSYNKYNCDIRCGMNIPIDTYRNLYNNFSGEGFAIKACTDFYRDNVYGYNGIDKDDYEDLGENWSKIGWIELINVDKVKWVRSKGSLPHSLFQRGLQRRQLPDLKAKRLL